MKTKMPHGFLQIKKRHNGFTITASKTMQTTKTSGPEDLRNPIYLLSQLNQTIALEDLCRQKIRKISAVRKLFAFFDLIFAGFIGLGMALSAIRLWMRFSVDLCRATE